MIVSLFSDLSSFINSYLKKRFALIPVHSKNQRKDIPGIITTSISIIVILSFSFCSCFVPHLYSYPIILKHYFNSIPLIPLRILCVYRYNHFRQYSINKLIYGFNVSMTTCMEYMNLYT